MKNLIFYLSLLLMLQVSFVSYAQEDDFDDFETETEFSSNEQVDDEFSNDEFVDSDESISTDDEFGEFSDEASFEAKPKTNWNRFYWAISILFATLIAGIFVRFEATRKIRPIFLLAAVVILGFYRGGPGIISSFQNTFLFFIGATDKWPAIVLFLGLIPITYFFGKVFCGWTCYLGAIQEFLYIGKFKILQSEKSQKVMRIIRYIIFIILLAQLTFTEGIEWSKIGPFKVIFNLFSPNITGYILLAVLLLSSLFIHRPFCKMVCPAGLFYGWITKLPGASVLGITDSCAGCKTCSISCQINAITRDDKTSILDNQECIMCGECMSDCKIHSIQPFMKGKTHASKLTLKGIKKLKIK
ncbi:MAG: 4Fe-4S binding protein [Bacteroidales bacterium]|nr:4Fe-4S binding protein [Bacteroidales bacterium]